MPKNLYLFAGLIALTLLLPALLKSCKSDSKCASDHDCNATKRCVVATGKCVSRSCTDDLGCPVGFSCESNQCVSEQLEQPPTFDLSVSTTVLDVVHETPDTAVTPDTAIAPDTADMADTAVVPDSADDTEVGNDLTADDTSDDDVDSSAGDSGGDDSSSDTLENDADTAGSD